MTYITIHSVNKNMIIDDFIEALYFCKDYDGDDELDLNNEGELTQKSIDKISHLVDCFIKDNYYDLLDVESLDPNISIGNNLYYEVMGHGAGFWDIPIINANGLGDKLSKYLDTYRYKYDISIDENNNIHFE